MQRRFEKMYCPACGAEMPKGLNVQGYDHPMVWIPGEQALSYWDAVKLTYSGTGKVSTMRRFTKRFRTAPSYYFAWYCEQCELLVTDTKIAMEKA